MCWRNSRPIFPRSQGFENLILLCMSIWAYLQDDTGDEDGALRSFSRAVCRLNELLPKESVDWTLQALAWLGQASSLGKHGLALQAETVLDETIRLLVAQEPQRDSGNDARFLLAQAYHERGRLRAMMPGRARDAQSDLGSVGLEAGSTDGTFSVA